MRPTQSLVCAPGFAALVASFAGVIPPVMAQCNPQLARFVATGGTGATGNFGRSAAISSDGSTAILGAFSDNGNIGAAYVFTRVDGSWVQQGPKLTGTGETGNGQLGISVSISADGNTAAVGAQADATSVGAVFVFTRDADTWTQLGAKLVPTGGTGAGQFGASVAISADGGTILVGANADATNVGAAYVFTRSGDTWTRQGSKLVPTGATGAGQFGRSVALSADGNTALVGANTDNTSFGAAYVFTRTAGVWTQQGTKLTGSGGLGAGQLGRSVSLSADGNTAAAGAFADNAGIGAAYVYGRTGNAWTQTARLLPAGGVGNGQFGLSVSLSSDGNSAILGANADSTSAGAAYVFSRSSGAWLQQGARLVPVGGVGPGQFGLSVALSGDASTALIGAQSDNTNVGAAYTFGLSPQTTVTHQPGAATVALGGSATFTVEAASATTLTFQWRSNGTALTDGPLASGTVVAGAVTPTLTLSSLAASDSGSAIDCLITSACGTTTSNPAGLVVGGGCGSPDFDGDGDVGTDADIEAFFRVLAGGNC